MSVTGPDAKLIATELVSEARRRLIDALVRPRSSTTASPPAAQQIAIVTKHLPAGMDPGRSRLAATMVEAQLLDAISSEASKPAQAETATARAVTTYLGNDDRPVTRPEAAAPNRPDAVAPPIAGARADLLAALGFTLARNRQIGEVDAPTAAHAGSGRHIRKTRSGLTAIAPRRAGKLGVYAAAAAAALLVWLLLF